MSLIAAFAPIWLITAAGWLAGRTGAAEPSAQRALIGFAFSFAMPAVLFSTLSQADLAAIPIRPLAAFACAALVVIAVGLCVGRFVYGDRLSVAAVRGMASGYVNSGNLGIPVAVQILGDTLLIAAVMIFHTVVVTPVFLLVMDASTGERTTGRWRIWLAPLRNPIVLASAAGLVCATTGIVVPAEVLAPIDVLGAAAVPTALFALGMSLWTPGESMSPQKRREVSWVVALKLLAQPLLGFLIARYLFGITGPMLFAVALLSTLPTAQVVFTYADRYRTWADTARDVVVWSSLGSLGTLTALTWLFG